VSDLAVVVDGQALPSDQAGAVWKRFSAWMEAHPADLIGFARSEQWASVHPEMHDGGPVLVASRSAPQRPYGIARTVSKLPKVPKPNGPPARGGRRGAKGR
jgi:hypothetical protein